MLHVSLEIKPPCCLKAGNAPLIIACKNGNVDLFLLTVEKMSKLDINHANDKGITPLHAACDGGKESIISELIRCNIK